MAFLHFILIGSATIQYRPIIETDATLSQKKGGNQWVNIGPAPIIGYFQPSGGRITEVAVDPTNPNHRLIGAANGGVWESRDGGSAWAPRTEDQISLAIGAVTFVP